MAPNEINEFKQLIHMPTVIQAKPIHKKDIFNSIKNIPQRPYFEDTKHIDGFWDILLKALPQR